jgi:hypothetical protein
VWRMGINLALSESSLLLGKSRGWSMWKMWNLEQWAVRLDRSRAGR